MTIFSLSEHLAFSFMPHDLSIDRLKEAIQKEMNISPCQFKNFHKTKDNWMGGGECLIFDFDYFMNIKTMISALKKYKYLIHTTKNHKKKKNGILSDRFRLYLFCKKVTLNRDQYENLLLNLCHLYGADIQGAVCSMAFKGFKDCEFYENDGELFDWEIYFKANKNDLTEPKKPIPIYNQKDKKTFMDSENWPKMFKPENIGSGNRNASFAKVLLWARDENCNRYEAEQILVWLNSRISEPLPNKEVQQLIKSKFK